MYTSLSSPTISASSKFARSERPNRAFNAGWNSFRPITSASLTAEARKTLTPTSSPACPSLPLTRTSLAGASALTDPDGLGVYLIRVCGLTTPSCPVPGVGLGGLAPSPDIPVLGGLAPPPDITVSGRLPLIQDDFRTHRAPLPSLSITARSSCSCAPPPQAPSTTYAISTRDDAPRPSRRTRSQTAISAGHTPSRPDYRKAAHSGFAAPAASASPPSRTSPPPRPDRLGYTKITNGRVATSSPPPSADLRSTPSPPTASLHPTAPDPDIQAAAAHLSNTLLNYSHHD